MSRRKFTSKFKTKVAIEALQEKSSLSELAEKHNIHPQQISNWKREFLSGAESVFDKGSKSKKTEAEEKEDHLLKLIGELKVENDFLKKALR